MNNGICTNVWTFTGLFNVNLGTQTEIQLGKDIFLCAPNPILLSVRNDLALNKWQSEEIDGVSSFLVHRKPEPQGAEYGREDHVEQLQNALMGIQVLKPTETIGFIFQGTESGNTLTRGRTTYRPPMNSGEWARMRALNTSLFVDVAATIKRVNRLMHGESAEKKNAIYLLQMALEHYHPLIKGLLSVAGLDALFDSQDRWDFRNKLCQSLGASTPAFPDWNSPIFPVPQFTVEQVAIDLYMLRNKIVHGVDLRKAARDKNSPVDLSKAVALVPDLAPRPYSLLLSEAAIYLLCRALQVNM